MTTNVIRFADGSYLKLAIAPRNKEDYLHELRRLSKLEWTYFRCGMLESTINEGPYPDGRSVANHNMLQVHNEQDLAVLRRKCIGSMRAWVVRNLKADWVDHTVPMDGFNTRKKS